jgi:hypothetical protein
LIPNGMSWRDRILYHQIHPLKLATDAVAAVAAAWLLWHRRLWPALVVGFVPPAAASAIVLRVADLDRLKRSAFGRYVAVHMTHTMEAVRLAGLAIFWLGAWLRWAWLLPIGLAIVLAGWSRGLWHRGLPRT